MAVTLEIFIDRLGNLENYLKKKVSEVVMEHQDKIVDLSTAQLMEGKNIEDKLMQTGYSTQYEKRRQKTGLQTKFVDLRFSGKYQDTKKLYKTREGFDIKSDADYEKYLRGNFPGHVGLTEKNSKVISDDLVNEIAILTKKYLTA